MHVEVCVNHVLRGPASFPSMQLGTTPKQYPERIQLSLHRFLYQAVDSLLLHEVLRRFRMLLFLVMVRGMGIGSMMIAVVVEKERKWLERVFIANISMLPRYREKSIVCCSIYQFLQYQSFLFAGIKTEIMAWLLCISAGASCLGSENHFQQFMSRCIGRLSLVPLHVQEIPVKSHFHREH